MRKKIEALEHAKGIMEWNRTWEDCVSRICLIKTYQETIDELENGTKPIRGKAGEIQSGIRLKSAIQFQEDKIKSADIFPYMSNSERWRGETDAKSDEIDRAFRYRIVSTYVM